MFDWMLPKTPLRMLLSKMNMFGLGNIMMRYVMKKKNVIHYHQLSSYREAIVIDPVRDLTKYMEVADSEGFKITQAAETHIHADFASGIRDVANV